MLPFALALAAIAPGKDSAKDPSTFQVAFPARLHAVETLHRERVRNLADGSQTEVIDQVTDLVLTALPAGGWQLVETLTRSSDTRNGAPAPDILNEILTGMPITLTFDAEGRIASVAGYETLGPRILALQIPPEIRQMLQKALDPAVLGEKAKVDARERFGALAGRPTKVGSAFGIPGPNGAIAAWSVTGELACPAGQCLRVEFHYPLEAGMITLAPGLSADVSEGNAEGWMAVDPATGLTWQDEKVEDRKLSMAVAGKESTGEVTDHLKRSWAIQAD